MNSLARLLVDLALAGVAVTFIASAFIWFGDTGRKLNRALVKVLKGQPDAVILSRVQGRAAGYAAQSGLIAVAWDGGDWCLVYRADELVGVELIIDSQVAAKAFRGEPRKALEQRSAAAGQVLFRLIFDDPKHPDFDIELWRYGDEQHKDVLTPVEAIAQANQWMARSEAILRRPAAASGAALPPLPVQTPIATALAKPPPPPEDDREPDLFDFDDDDPPWDEGPDKIN